MFASGTMEYATMSKSELIGRIRDVNRSARPEFLTAFTESELAAYLRRLAGVEVRGEFIEQPLLFE